MKKIIIVGLATLISFGSFASEKELEGLMDVFKVTVNEENTEVITKALDAKPSDLLEYKITYKNTTEKEFSDISVVGKIPESTTFVKDSAFNIVSIDGKEVDKNYVPVFSIDNGETWSIEPTKKIIKDGKITEVKADMSDYNMIKWDIEKFAPISEKVFKYRVVVDTE